MGRSSSEAAKQVERGLRDHPGVVRRFRQLANPGHGEERREPHLEVDARATASLTAQVFDHLVCQRAQRASDLLGRGEVALVGHLVPVCTRDPRGVVDDDAAPAASQTSDVRTGVGTELPDERILC